MRNAIASFRHRFDRLGIVLSGLCAVHCMLTALLVGVLGIGGGVLLSPEIHHVGLALAVMIAGIGLGFGAYRHGQRLPLAIGAAGLALMTTALFVGHGLEEGLFTVSGVVLVAFAHIRNLHAGH
ncbi:MerC domain-containing protein [Novosphingobium sp. 9]|uniref:MerC domain-containing protein n=1 Tax=Novosphingobium sp. 9 TaxID=2025349 RepID=UPI0021B539F8|nr:MerC domain-containing protein [Novosphingobium sp. 9]